MWCGRWRRGRALHDTVLVTPEPGQQRPHRRHHVAPTAPRQPHTSAEEGRGVRVPWAVFLDSAEKMSLLPSSLDQNLMPWLQLDAGRVQPGAGPLWLISRSFLVSIPLLKFLICSCTVCFFLEGLQHSDRGYFKARIMDPAPGPAGVWFPCMFCLLMAGLPASMGCVGVQSI